MCLLSACNVDGNVGDGETQGTCRKGEVCKADGTCKGWLLYTYELIYKYMLAQVYGQLLHYTIHNSFSFLLDTCSDSIKNGDETGIDCGGYVCMPCSKLESSNYISKFLSLLFVVKILK